MKLLDLFSKTRSITDVFEEHSHRTLTVGIDEKYNPDLCVDIIEWDYEELDFKPDVIWASPPCRTFSVASISAHWAGGACAYIPKSKECFNGLQNVSRVLEIINYFNPTLWFIENPMGVLRKIGVMRDLPRYMVTYCQYGDTRMKPTDIWTNCNDWKPRAPCKNGDSCHEAAPRGSRTGTQRLKLLASAKIPEELCYEIRDVCETVVHTIER